MIDLRAITYSSNYDNQGRLCIPYTSDLGHLGLYEIIYRYSPASTDAISTY